MLISGDEKLGTTSSSALKELIIVGIISYHTDRTLGNDDDREFLQPFNYLVNLRIVKVMLLA